MAVESKHVNASLRLMDSQRETIKTLTRISPSITSVQVAAIGDAIQIVRGQALGNATLTIVSELVSQ